MARPKLKIDDERKRIANMTRKLWQFGYRARSLYGLGLNYNMLVNDRYRVLVSDKMIKQFPKDVNFFVLDENGEYTYFKKFTDRHFIGDKSPTRIIPLEQTAR